MTAVRVANGTRTDQRKKVVDRMVREPLVFRVFTDVAVIDVELEVREDP